MANALLQMILVTYELIGQPISDAAAKAILAELRTYPKADVMDALMRCQKELRKLTLADILDRIPSGHPKVEEAWALVAQSLDNEDISLVWTNEMAMACGAARLLREDKVAARMAFKEVYTEAVNKARAKKSPPVWRVSLGYDPSGREHVVLEAVRKGQLSIEFAMKLLPDYTVPKTVNALLPDLRSL